jgi:hypothetical protein
MTADVPRWRKGRVDLVPLAIMAAPMFLGALGTGSRAGAETALVAVAIAVGWSLKHWLPPEFEDAAVVPPAAALLIVLSTAPGSVELLFLAAVAGVGFLLWMGVEPGSGVSLGDLVEPVAIPALAVGVALAVMLFLPIGTGDQVGLAALALVGVLGLVAWLYLRSPVEAAGPEPTS